MLTDVPWRKKVILQTAKQTLLSWIIGFFLADLLVQMVFKSWALNPAEGSKVTVSRNM